MRAPLPPRQVGAFPLEVDQAAAKPTGALSRRSVAVLNLAALWMVTSIGWLPEADGN